QLAAGLGCELDAQQDLGHARALDLAEQVRDTLGVGLLRRQLRPWSAAALHGPAESLALEHRLAAFRAQAHALDALARRAGELEVHQRLERCQEPGHGLRG